MSHSLVEARKKVASAKKFGIPTVVLWFGWFTYEVYLQDNELANGLFWGGVVGGVVGVIADFKFHFRTQHQYQEIIDQIEDLTADQQ